MNILLVRNESSDLGTFGELSLNGLRLCYTCEDPWNNNAKGESCIPEGVYECSPHSSAKYPDVWVVNNVPNRDAILIHNGNTIKDTRGCILVGTSKGFIDGKPAVLGSKNALVALRRVLPPHFTLTIQNKWVRDGRAFA